MESELMLSILSSLAESESVSISENEKWGIKRRFQNGTFIISMFTIKPRIVILKENLEKTDTT